MDKGLFFFNHSHGFFVKVVADFESFQISGGVHAFAFVLKVLQFVIFVVEMMGRESFVLGFFASAVMLTDSFGVGMWILVVVVWILTICGVVEGVAFGLDDFF